MDFIFVKSHFYNLLFELAHYDFLTEFCFILVSLIFINAGKTISEKLKLFSLIVFTSFAAFFGARLLHVIIEKPELTSDPVSILNRFDGMTFNGSLLFGTVTFFIGMMYFNKNHRPRYLDLAAIGTSLTYGILRIRCFALGCCWGKISSVPWSVTYYDSHFTPILGLPLHPVQIYDSILGFLIAGILIHLYRRKGQFEGHLFFIFLGLYSIGRFFTEFYRGDVFRGENIIGGLSVSQIVSLILLTFLTGKYTFSKFMNIKK